MSEETLAEKMKRKAEEVKAYYGKNPAAEAMQQELQQEGPVSKVTERLGLETGDRAPIKEVLPDEAWSAVLAADSPANRLAPDLVEAYNRGKPEIDKITYVATGPHEAKAVYDTQEVRTSPTAATSVVLHEIGHQEGALGRMREDTGRVLTGEKYRELPKLENEGLASAFALIELGRKFGWDSKEFNAGKELLLTTYSSYVTAEKKKKK